ncbi:DUF6359 domain-containing protein [Bacillus testis]|uniref:DUF6359 domain-containing protein n=1 Tax=Bacillus testis TaxID=1622072 RepID=UPI00067F2771|nr:DUF6359 domain-containing protein [Bacillus testis]
MNMHAMKKISIVCMAFLLIFGLSAQSFVIKADASFTVKEAIANNNGDATVEGYIVGYTSASKSYVFNGPFKDDNNFAIADDPNEKDPANIMPVQLTSAYRAAYGLSSNPGNIGKKVKVSGSLEAYFSSPGLKSPTKMEWVEANAQPVAEQAVASPAAGAVKSGTQVTLKTNSEGAMIHYSIDGSNPTESSPVYQQPITIDKDMTIKAMVTKESYKNSDISVFTYKIAKTGLRIHDIQGASHNSPYLNQYVADVEGIVTYVDDSNNAYIQDQKPDKDEKTSEGLLIYKKQHGLQVGDVVKVNGQVKEQVLQGYSEKMQTDLSVTEINASSLTVVKSGQSLPKPVVIGKDRKQPTEIIDNDAFVKFDPQQDGIDFYESLEGMLIEIKDAKVIAPQNYGELYVVPGNVKTNTDTGALRITAKDYNPERLIVEIGDKNYVAKTGDYFKGSIYGVVSYGYSNFKVKTKKENLPSFVEGKTKRETTDLKKHDKKLTVASYNVENFSAKDSDEKVTKLAMAIVKNLNQPDIIGVTEVQDNDGPADTGTTDATKNFKLLADKIKALGGPTYQFTDIAPENNKDGGAPGGNIRVGFLYNSDRVSLVEGRKGTATESVGYENRKLTVNPGRIDPTNEAFRSSRKPLAAQFQFRGKKVIVVANHFNSKGGDQPLFGKNQPPILSSEIQRLKIAGIVNSFVKDVKKKDKNANIILLGDFNDFEFSAPLQKVKGKELTDMIDKVKEKKRYTYSYQGNAQVLDHILVTKNMEHATKVDIVHINSQFMEQHGRASDHDPVLIQTELKSK